MRKNHNRPAARWRRGLRGGPLARADLYWMGAYVGRVVEGRPAHLLRGYGACEARRRDRLGGPLFLIVRGDGPRRVTIALSRHPEKGGKGR